MNVPGMGSASLINPVRMKIAFADALQSLVKIILG
jgi:hypothetical protein